MGFGCLFNNYNPTVSAADAICFLSKQCKPRRMIQLQKSPPSPFVWPIKLFHVFIYLGTNLQLSLSSLSLTSYYYMFFRYVCGFRNPKAKKEESELPWKSPTSIASTKPSKRSRIKSFFSSSRKSKKTSYSIAELDKRRQNIIYTQDREVSLVHFVYSGPTNLIPVVAKQKNKNQPKKPDNLMTLAYGSRQPLQVVDSEAIKEQFKERRVESTGLSKERSFVSSSNRETSWYLAAALALILLVVVSSGKPFAIFCCSVFWYLVPALRGKEANVGKHQWIRRKIYKCG